MRKQQITIYLDDSTKNYVEAIANHWGKNSPAAIVELIKICRTRFPEPTDLDFQVETLPPKDVENIIDDKINGRMTQITATLDECYAANIKPLQEELEALTKKFEVLESAIANLTGNVYSEKPTSTTTETSQDIGTGNIFCAIAKINQENNLNNFVPIYLVRDFFPQVSRTELDALLFQLEKSDLIEFSSLVDPSDYSSEQIRAGIPQVSGGSLFYIQLKDDVIANFPSTSQPSASVLEEIVPNILPEKDEVQHESATSEENLPDEQSPDSPKSEDKEGSDNPNLTQTEIISLGELSQKLSAIKKEGSSLDTVKRKWREFNGDRQKFTDWIFSQSNHQFLATPIENTLVPPNNTIGNNTQFEFKFTQH